MRISLYAFSAVGAVLGILGGGLPLAAQLPPQPVFEESVVVTATLEESDRDETPASVTVLGQEEIRDRRETAALDLLATVPGLTVIQSGTPGKQTSIFSRGAASTQTLVLWNGVPLNDPYFGGFDWAHLGTHGLERIEVVRGPRSGVYGSAALGATVNLITGRQQGVRFQLEGGENAYLRGAFSTGWGLDHSHYDVIANHRTGDGELPNDGYDRTGLTLRAMRFLGPSGSISLIGRWVDADVEIPRSGGVPTPERAQEQRDLNLAVPLALETGAWSFSALASRVTSDFKFTDPQSFFSLNDTEGELLRGRAHALRSLELSAGGSGWAGIGGEWQREEVTNLSTFGLNLDGESQENRAVFAQARLGGERWSLEGSVRFDDNLVFGSETSPALGTSLRLREGLRLKASYGEGFRAPSLGELFFPFSGNPDLQPEVSETVEVGLEGEIPGDRATWRYQVTVFDTQQENLIDFDPVSFTNVNIGRAEVQGVEAVLSVVSDFFTLRANATFLDTEDRDTGLALLRRPDESASAVLTLRPGRWVLTGVARYVGARPDLDAVTFARTENDSYLRLDAVVSFEYSFWLTPFLRLDNVADESYEEALGFPAPGRTVSGGISLLF